MWYTTYTYNESILYNLNNNHYFISCIHHFDYMSMYMIVLFLTYWEKSKLFCLIIIIYLFLIIRL